MKVLLGQTIEEDLDASGIWGIFLTSIYMEQELITCNIPN